MERIPTAAKRCSLALLVLCALLWGACGGEPEPAESSPARLHWAPIEGAEHYTVRVWAGYRLLFEESVPDTALALDADHRRAMAPFDSLRLELLGEVGWEEDAERVGRRVIPIRP